MRVNNKKLLSEMIAAFPEAAAQLRAWQSIAEQVDWNSPHEIKSYYPQAKVIGSKNIIFKIRGNSYRLWAKINYATHTIYIKRFGTHRDYDKWEIT